LRSKPFAKDKWQSHSLRCVKILKASENTRDFTISNEKRLRGETTSPVKVSKFQHQDSI
jgi:hypothetical protein